MSSGERGVAAAVIVRLTDQRCARLEEAGGGSSDKYTITRPPTNSSTVCPYTENKNEQHKPFRLFFRVATHHTYIRLLFLATQHTQKISEIAPLRVPTVQVQHKGMLTYVLACPHGVKKQLHTHHKVSATLLPRAVRDAATRTSKRARIQPYQ